MRGCFCCRSFGLNFRRCGRFCDRCCRSGCCCGTGELALLDALIDDDGEIAAGGIDDRCQTLRRRVDEEKELREELFLARHGGQFADLANVDHLAVDDAQLEGELGVVLDPGGKSLGESYRITGGVSNRRDALEPLERLLDFGSFCSACSQLVLDDVVASAGAANSLAQLEVLRGGEAFEGAADRGGRERGPGYGR